MEKAFVLCPAKINLFLNVIGDEENNKHLLKMVNQSVDLYDYITITSNESGAIKITCNDENVPTDQNNTCYQAAVKMQSYYEIWDGFDIHIEKRIPLGSGLGGESTDAAGVLHAINKMYDLNVPLVDLASIGNQIGSDIPFCVVGGGAIVSGTGEIVRPVLEKMNYHYLIVKPGYTIDTAAAFQRFDEVTYEYSEYDFLLGLNDLEIVAPNNVQIIKETLANNGAYFTIMSGSGPAVVGGFTNKSKRLKALKAIRNTFADYQTFLAEPCSGVTVTLKRQLN